MVVMLYPFVMLIMHYPWAHTNTQTRASSMVANQSSDLRRMSHAQLFPNLSTDVKGLTMIIPPTSKQAHFTTHSCPQRTTYRAVEVHRQNHNKWVWSRTGG